MSLRLREALDTHWRLLSSAVHLIASASYPFPEVLLALAEPMSVFPVEGLPESRYLPGTAAMDDVEDYAEQLLQTLFATGDSYRATIQPHSGTQANQVVFNAVLRPGDKVLSLAASEGGHISHTVLVGRRNHAIHYPLAPDGLIDYEKLDELSVRSRPRLIIAGGSAYPREIDFARLGDVARRCGAFLHADVSHTATFIAAGLHSSAMPHADFVSFNTVKNMRGPNGGVLMYRSELHTKVARALFPDTQGGGNENTMLAKVVALEALSHIDLPAYAKRMIENAKLIARTLQSRGVDIVTQGTDSHIVLVDLRNANKTGASVEEECCRYGVLVNRNLIPSDPAKPMVASGIRIGTACASILGYLDSDLAGLAHWIGDRIQGIASDDPRSLVAVLTSKYNKPFLSTY